MISEKMRPLAENNSVIRVMFEEGKRLAAIYGAENVYDFSLGNPNVPAPDEVKESILEILEEEESVFVHGYMSNAGYEDVRETIADSLNARFGTSFGVNNILMTVGAASGLNVILKTVLEPGDEVIVFAPYFVEYGNYVRNYDGTLVVISPNTEDFQPNLEELKEKITLRTRAVIINTPNNPTGVVYSAQTLERLAEILRQKKEEFGTEILLISDEPYRELAYDGVEGICLSVYRYVDGDPEAMAAEFVASVDKPLIITGSIGNDKRLEFVKNLKPWGFTIGSALFDDSFGRYAHIYEKLDAISAKLS